jgi:hypothetical protein
VTDRSRDAKTESVEGHADGEAGVWEHASGNAAMKRLIAGREYVDAIEMAAESGLSKSGVLRLARLGRVPYYEVGRRWWFAPEEFMAALRRGPDAQKPLDAKPDQRDVSVVPLRRVPR